MDLGLKSEKPSVDAVAETKKWMLTIYHSPTDDASESIQYDSSPRFARFAALVTYFPITAVLTGACVHDSQVAIPLMTLTSQRVTYLYGLMDAAYDASSSVTQRNARSSSAHRVRPALQASNEEGAASQELPFLEDRL
ncbi:MAG: hypothetical protein ACR2JB_17725 [Bryobacteraceae bacterium]